MTECSEVPTPPQLIQPLDPGPVDIIGDVHGEIEPLTALLRELGYSSKGKHPHGRRLVFVGDLVDRGPASAEVVGLVANLVATGRAQCILGNHELNILRDDPKADNEWFFEHTDPATKNDILEFLVNLPLALERPDLRVVHACWDSPSIEASRTHRGAAIDLFGESEKRIERALSDEGIAQKAKQEKTQQPLRDYDNPPPQMLPNFAESEYRQQVENPVKVLTSGIECIADERFWTNGQWRYTQRVPWWNQYDDDAPVVVGHYWRSRHSPKPFAKGEPGIFGNAGPADRLGPAKQVMCIDYSIGWRSKERAKGDGRGPFETALAAYRLHEGADPELIFAPV